MSVTAPLPPTRVPTSPSSGGPGDPAVLELLLLASRPERERRLVAWALGGALLLHLLLLSAIFMAGPLGGNWLTPIRIPQEPGERTITLLLPGTYVSGGGEVGGAPAVERTQEERLVAPTHIPTRIPRVPVPGQRAPGAPTRDAGQAGAAAGAVTAGAGEGGAGGAAFGNSAARFRPRTWDRRLWEEPDRLLPTQSDAARVASRVQQKLDAVNDSAAAVADAARKATNWTIKDKNGKEWGVSPGKLHLGNITLPLPLGFQAPPGRRDEFEKNQANWDEIQRSASYAEIHHTFDERVKAIRERKEKERKEQEAKKSNTTTSN